jgi:hypothetical protein
VSPAAAPADLDDQAAPDGPTGDGRTMVG